MYYFRFPSLHFYPLCSSDFNFSFLFFHLCIIIWCSYVFHFLLSRPFSFSTLTFSWVPSFSRVCPTSLRMTACLTHPPCSPHSSGRAHRPLPAFAVWPQQSVPPGEWPGRVLVPANIHRQPARVSARVHDKYRVPRRQGVRQPKMH